MDYATWYGDFWKTYKMDSWSSCVNSAIQVGSSFPNLQYHDGLINFKEEQFNAPHGRGHFFWRECSTLHVSEAPIKLLSPFCFFPNEGVGLFRIPLIFSCTWSPDPSHASDKSTFCLDKWPERESMSLNCNFWFSVMIVFYLWVFSR